MKKNKLRTNLLRLASIVNRIALVLSLSYVLLVSAAHISGHFSPKIKSESELQQLIEEHKKKLNCTKNIEGKFRDRKGGRAAIGLCSKAIIKREDNQYNEFCIKLGEGYRNLSTVKHEVYHICDGHVQGDYNPIIVNCWHEPQAYLHELTGLKP